MRRARASYHYAIRFVKRNENNIVNEHLAEALVNNRRRDFWCEVKRILINAVAVILMAYMVLRT